MHYVLCIKVGASPLTELGSALTLCIKRFMHYYHMHCDDFNCTLFSTALRSLTFHSPLSHHCDKPRARTPGTPALQVYSLLHNTVHKYIVTVVHLIHSDACKPEVVTACTNHVPHPDPPALRPTSTSLPFRASCPCSCSCSCNPSGIPSRPPVSATQHKSRLPGLFLTLLTY